MNPSQKNCLFLAASPLRKDGKAFLHAPTSFALPQRSFYMIMQKGILLSEREEFDEKTWKAAAAAAAVMACGFSVSAEEPAVYSLDQVVVTASRTPEKELDANADINVVTREEIQKRHYQDVSEALRHIPVSWL